MPHQKIREDNKKRVVEEAARLFLENGIENTTFEMIAKVVGITKRSILNYFSTKQELIIDVYKFYEEEQRALADARSESDSFQKMNGMDRLLFVVDRAISHARDYGKTVHHIEKLQHYLMKEKVWDIKEFHLGANVLSYLVTDSIRIGKEDGSIKGDSFPNKYDIDIFIVAVLGMLKEIAFYAAIDDETTQIYVDELVSDAREKIVRLSRFFFGA